MNGPWWFTAATGWEWLAGKRQNLYSQFGEDGIVDAIFDKIGTKNRWCFECGAHDGVFMSNTRRLIDRGWDAVLVEADATAFARLSENLKPERPSVRLMNHRVEASVGLTMDTLLAKQKAPADIDLVCIDVDGPDYYLWNSMLMHRPRVVVIEHALPSDENAWFIPAQGGTGQAGYLAMQHLAMGKFYQTLCQTFTNTISIRQDL